MQGDLAASGHSGIMGLSAHYDIIGGRRLGPALKGAASEKESYHTLRFGNTFSEAEVFEPKISKYGGKCLCECL
jgi:hypothetical protein